MTRARLPHARRLSALAVLAMAMAVGLLGLPPASAGLVGGHGISTISATDTSLTISGMAPASSTVKIYRFGPEVDPAQWSSGTLVSTVNAGSGGAFTATVSRSANGSELYDAYQAVAGTTMLGSTHHVDQWNVTPMATYPYPTSPTKKGLQVQMTSDAEDLGIGHAAINVAFDGIMQMTSEGAQSIPFVSGGVTYYFDKDAVEELDRQIKPLSDNGTVVNLILILYRSTKPNSAVSVLLHPDATTDGIVYSFNTKTSTGVRYTRAAFEFVTQRWTRPDQQYGRATGFIVGNEVDAQFIWQNAGLKSLTDFTREYERTLRIAYAAGRTAYAHARIYTSLTANWQQSSDPGKSYHARDVVESLNALTKAHGDYPWAVAYHPYPTPMDDPTFWDMPNATTDVETTPLISLRNIEVLPTFLARPAQLTAGQPRRVILYEQGCATPGTSLADEQLQAACYALAYYKVRFLPGIDSFILHRHVDHKFEDFLRLGLWTWDRRGDQIATPDRRKLIWTVFRGIDTAASESLTAFAKPLIGITDWSQKVDNWDASQLAVSTPPTRVGAGWASSTTTALSLAAFTTGLDGWRASDDVTSVAAVGGKLTASFSTFAGIWRGVDVVLPAAVNASATPRLALSVATDGPHSLGSRHIRVRAYAVDGSVADATALVQDSTEHRLVVDLASWPGRTAVKRLKVWVSAEGNDPWSGTLTLDDIALVSAATGLPSGVDLIASTPGALTAGSTVALTVSNTDSGPMSATLTFPACDGLTLTPASATISALPPGGSQTLSLSLAAAYPADASRADVCVSVGAATYRVPVRTTGVSLLQGFESGSTEGWTAGTNVVSVASTTSMANGPQAPESGARALVATSTPVAPSAERVLVYQPSTPLNLSTATAYSIAVNSYGGAGTPMAARYRVRLTLISGTERRETLVRYMPDSWQRVTLDVESWARRSSVNRIEVAFSVLGSSLTSWAPAFNLDGVGTYARSPESSAARPDEVLVQDFETVPTSAGWSPLAHASALTVTDAFDSRPGTAAQGRFGLEFTGGAVPTTTSKSLRYTPTKPWDLSGAQAVTLRVNSWGGAPGVPTDGYQVTLTARSGSSVTSTTVPYKPDQWNDVLLDISSWAGRSSIDSMDVSFGTSGSTGQTWSGKFQVDSLGFRVGGRSLSSLESATTEAWTPGSNVNGLAAVTTFANAPHRAGHGLHVLEATGSGPTAASRTITWAPPAPANLSLAAALTLRINSYGGAPGATGYTATVTARSGSQSRTTTTPITPDAWNTVSVNLAGWAARNAITSVDVTVTANGGTGSWSGKFQVDGLVGAP